jgi:hypothetical protein
MTIGIDQFEKAAQCTVVGNELVATRGCQQNRFSLSCQSPMQKYLPKSKWSLSWWKKKGHGFWLSWGGCAIESKSKSKMKEHLLSGLSKSNSTGVVLCAVLPSQAQNGGVVAWFLGGGPILWVMGNKWRTVYCKWTLQVNRYSIWPIKILQTCCHVTFRVLSELFWHLGEPWLTRDLFWPIRILRHITFWVLSEPWLVLSEPWLVSSVDVIIVRSVPDNCPGAGST